MHSLIRLSDFTKENIKDIFKIADELHTGKYDNFLSKKTLVMFFPDSSIRTRVTFEKGIFLLSGQSILFPPETLDKKESLSDVAGYLNNWCDCLIIRHKNISVIDELIKYADFPIINAMTDINHPCEIISDMYALSKIRGDFTKDKFLFVGADGNIGRTWKEASELMGFSLAQCSPLEYAIEGISHVSDLNKAITGKDIICTDSLSHEELKAFRERQITLDIMKRANDNAVLNPCPPFYRGEEVSDEVMDSPCFVGYSFKKYLLEIQQAIIIFSLM